MTTIFKVGGKVVLMNDSGKAARAGALAEVVEIRRRSWGDDLKVKWDRTTNDLAQKQMDGTYSAAIFGRAPEAATTVTRSPIGFTDDDMKFVRKQLIAMLTNENFKDLTEEDVGHAARLIHRLGRVG